MIDSESKERFEKLVADMKEIMRQDGECAGLAYHVAETVENILDESEYIEQMQEEQ